MSLVPRPFPAALPHSTLREVLPGIHFVTGSMRMPGFLPVTFSRNMTVIQEGERLVLLNTVRLDDAGLAQLDALGKVTDVIRLAGNHGMDDPFYKNRYGAKVWVVRGQRYTAGFNASAPQTYFTPDAEMDSTTELPLAGATLHIIDSKPPEGLLHLERSGGVIIAGDCLQHWHEVDPYFSFVARFMLPRLGFIKPHNIGPGWFKNCKPPIEQVRAILKLQFSHVMTSHGAAVIDDAVNKYRPAIERLG